MVIVVQQWEWRFIGRVGVDERGGGMIKEKEMKKRKENRIKGKVEK